MAASATLTLNGKITSGIAGNSAIGPLTASSSAANQTIQQVVLASGANTITVPSAPAPTMCIIKLPSDNTAVVTLKGITGDTGIAIGKTGWFVLCFDPTAVPSSFVLNSASAQTGKYTEIRFL